MDFALRFIIGMADFPAGFILRFTIGTVAFPGDFTPRFNIGTAALFAALSPPLNNIGKADLASQTMHRGHTLFVRIPFANERL